MATGTAQRPAMTASQARAFAGYSVGNAIHVKRALACGCEPYEDVFTYRRWQAMGFQVIRGAKAVHLPVITERAEEDKDTGDMKTVRVFSTACVFCKHQVKVL